MNSNIKLYPHQKVWVENIINILENNYGYIDTSTMGSGKTYIGVYLAKILNLSIFIIGPITLRKNWIDLCEANNVECVEYITYQSLRGFNNKKNKFKIINNDWVIERQIYDHENKLINRYQATDNFRELINEGILLICDEIQNIKNDSSQYHSVRALIDQILLEPNTRTRYALLSGTPFDKKEHSFNLMKLIGYTTEDRLYVNNIARNIKEFTGFNEIVENCRLKNPDLTQEILNNFPKISTRNVSDIVFELYSQVVKPLISGSMDTRGIIETKLSLRNGFFKINPINAGNLSRIINQFKLSFNEGSKPDFSSITDYMKDIEKYKTYDMARVGIEYLEFNYQSKLVISVNFHDTVHQLNKFLIEYQPLIVTGETDYNDRNKYINLFNNSPNYRIIIITTQTGGVGISLHDVHGNAPRMMIISPTFKFIDTIQATGRIYRTGTKSDAIVVLFYGQGDRIEIEKSILGSYNRKSKVMEKIVDKNLSGTILPDEYENYFEE